MGRVLIFPTDTVYGIGCSVSDKEGISKIYEIKHRPLYKPLACLCDSLEQIEMVAILDDNAKKLIDSFMPGALTIILKARDTVSAISGFSTIGVRIPNSEVARKILKENGPMFVTSVNESGEPPINSYEELVEKYSGVVDEIFRDDSVSSSIASTVAEIIDGKVNIIREGEVTKEQIESMIKVLL